MTSFEAPPTDVSFDYRDAPFAGACSWAITRALPRTGWMSSRPSPCRMTPVLSSTPPASSSGVSGPPNPQGPLGRNDRRADAAPRKGHPRDGLSPFPAPAASTLRQIRRKSQWQGLIRLRLSEDTVNFNQKTRLGSSHNLYNKCLCARHDRFSRHRRIDDRDGRCAKTPAAMSPGCTPEHLPAAFRPV